jgi:hypothetical protein
MRTLSAATFEQSLCGTNLECGTSITLAAGIWRFGSAIYQTIPLTIYLLLGIPDQISRLNDILYTSKWT